MSLPFLKQLVRLGKTNANVNANATVNANVNVNVKISLLLRENHFENKKLVSLVLLVCVNAAIRNVNSQGKVVGKYSYVSNLLKPFT
jgi:hypothetical protein